MARRHGIAANTYKRFVIDSGAVYKNYGLGNEVLMGATRGGSTFRIEQEIRTMEVDGAKGDVVGDKRIIKVRPILEINFIEISTDLIKAALPGADSADYPATQGKTHDRIYRALDLATSDYIDNIAIVGECTGNATAPIVCGINHCLANGNFEIGFADNDESVVKLTFVGHFVPTDLDTEPWFIRFPTIS